MSNTIETKNPATGEIIYTWQKQSKEQAAKVIEAADQAFKSWREVSVEDRADIIGKIGEQIKSNNDKLAAMITNQMGKPVAQANSEIDLCVGICEYTAKHGGDFIKNEEREFDGEKSIVTYQPIGVILAMQPWNFPLYQIVRYSISNLFAGNTTVFKHAEIVWGTAELIVKLYHQAGVPEDAFAMLYVDDETVDELIAHNKVRGVTLTGSAEAGKIVGAKAGEPLNKAVLELGGSDPYLILADAELDTIIDTCVQGRVNNCGQTCVAAKRFIVVESVYDELKEKFVKAMQQVEYGDPTNEKTTTGSMAHEELREKVHAQVKKSLEKGAVCLTGGEIPQGEGYFYPATVLENVTPDMPAYEEEIFGSVATLIKVKDEAEAIKVANDHSYGLGGGVFSADVKRATEIARTELDTGMVNVNGYALAQPNLPFGGVKESGYGREHGGFGIREFVNIKTVIVND